MNIIPTQQILGAQIQDLDLSVALTEPQVDKLILALGTYGVLEFPNQTLTTAQLKSFSERFGELYVSPGGRAQASLWVTRSFVIPTRFIKTSLKTCKHDSRIKRLRMISISFGI